MSLIVLVLVVLLTLTLLSGPWYPYSREWGYYPFGGGVGLVLVVLLILLLVGRV